MKKLVNAPISNTIYWATVNEKNHTMNTDTRVDVTDVTLKYDDILYRHNGGRL